MEKLHAGLDVGDRTTSVCVVRQNGDIVLEAVAETTPESIASILKPFRKSLKTVGQECGSKSAWLHRELTRSKYPMLSIDAYHAHGLLKTRLNKTDRNDAHGLALLLAKEMYKAAHIKSEEAIQIRALLLLREITLRKANDLVAAQRMVMNRLGPQPKAMARRRTALRDGASQALDAALQGIATSKEALLEQHLKIHQLVFALAKDHPLCRRLMTVPGVGPITALTFIAAIDDPLRFKSSRTVAAYLGLTPRLFQSGVTSRSGGISHRGDPAARKALFMAGRSIISVSRSNCSLRRWGVKIAAAKGNKIASVACARKLAVLLHHLWITGQEFDPSK